MDKRQILSATIAASLLTYSVVSTARVAPQSIVHMSLLELRHALDSGEVHAVDVVSAYMLEINANNSQGKKLDAVIAINPAAMEEAQAWDAQHAAHPGQASGALAGIPFLAKDNYNTKGIITSGGSVALSTSKPVQNAFIIQRLVDNGAILLGKTNLSELAASYGWLGYSGYGGQTVNPYNPLRDASGSSSGSAAAVAAHFAPFALGTDTSGSIRGPASVTGSVGMRPTLGLTSRTGIIPLSLTSDDAGVITRTVQDQAIVLDVIRGQDKADAATLIVRQPEQPFSDALKKDALRGKTLAIVDNFDGANPDIDRIKAMTDATLQRDGAKVVHITLPKIYEGLWGAVLGPVGTAEFRPQFNTYLSKLGPGQPHNMTEFMTRLKTLTADGTQHINPGRYKGLVENYTTKTTDSPEYIAILTHTIPTLRHQLTAIMDQGHYDALVLPTMSCPASVIHGKSDPLYVCHSSDEYAPSYIAPATGFPEITVNAGWAAGHVPVGMSFLGRANSDAQLLGMAYSFEMLKH